jgi:seryl-tRNA synthetase
MIDLRALRDNPDAFRRSQEPRGADVGAIDAALAADEARRQANTRYDNLRAEQKSLGREVASAKGPEKEALLARTKALSAEVKEADAALAGADATLAELLAGIPNLVADGVPVGGEDDYAVLEHVGTPRDFAAEGFAPRDHVELGRLLAAIDIERGVKVSGSRFYYLTGVGAQLELALLNLAMSFANEAGFTSMIPPALVKPRAMEGTGFLGQAAQDVYRLEADDMYLVGTSEVPLAAYHSDEILPAAALPLRYAAFSPCFRREAGSYGRDTAGIYRVHWFDKVEMFVFTRPEDAAAEHERLLQLEQDFLGLLEIPYRVIDTAAGDLGLSAARKYDCEAWIPSRDGYGELTSTSNCTEFQARRLGIRMREEAAGSPTAPVATLNGTLCAMARTIIAVLENHQQADGSVRVPPALRPYLGGREVLTVPGQEPDTGG